MGREKGNVIATRHRTNCTMALLKSFPKSILLKVYPNFSSKTAEKDISGAKTSPHSHNLFIGALNVLIMNQNPNVTGQPKSQTARADCCVKTARNPIL